VDGLPVALAALREPGFERRREMRGRYTETGFEAAFGGGKRVFKLGVIREISHAKGVKPFKRAGLALSADDEINGEFLGVHGASITFDLS
jgi:hypothetical protein